MKETHLRKRALGVVLSLRPNTSQQSEPPNAAVRRMLLFPHLLPQCPNTLRMTGVMKKFLDITAARVALGRIIPHGVIIAGAVSAELKCNSG